jgi:hypothetical protein
MAKTIEILIHFFTRTDHVMLAQNASFHAKQIAEQIARYNSRALPHLRIKP